MMPRSDAPPRPERPILLRRTVQCGNVRGRILTGDDHRECHDSYVARGGFARLAARERLLEHIHRAGIRGRGGAGFPLGRKIEAVHPPSEHVIVVANGEEGEPPSIKDRWLLANRPSMVIDGLSIVAGLTGARTGYVYVSNPQCEASVAEAIIDFEHETARPHIDLEVVRVEPSYVAGEETAVVRAIEGGPALPADKPPRPTESGIGGRPTVVSNVETLAQLALLNTLGLEQYASVGTPTDAGTFLLTVTTRRDANLCEVPFGTSLAEVLRGLGLQATDSSGLVVGGYFGGLYTPKITHVPLGYADLAAHGASLGCGAVTLLDADECPIAVASAIMRFYAEQNAAQCGSCFNGTAAMSQSLHALTCGQASPLDVVALQRWARQLRGRGACGTLDGATHVVGTLLEQFDTQVSQHIGHRCAACESTRDSYQPTPFAVSLDDRNPTMSTLTKVAARAH